ncbi:Imm1 family immunity protein [Actinoalloteichus caeruleus]|uniref:Imm1 family immunity protein n=1 Tax=Actinoalloteichus cyanogriseus TaxID=2893586 RepID=UPI003AB0EC73
MTAALTTGSVRVTRGAAESFALIDEVLRTEHVSWETTLNVGDVAYYQSKEGPYPNHEFRISVRPSFGIAACCYIDHDDEDMPFARSWSSQQLSARAHLIYSGATGAVFPRTAAILIPRAREGLREWLATRKRPTCIEWRPMRA